MSGSGTGDLMDEIVRDLPPETKNEEEELPRITIVGRPNVGKSSLRSPAPRATPFTRATTSTDSISTWSIRPACAKKAR